MALLHVFRQTGVHVEFITSAGLTRFAFAGVVLYRQRGSELEVLLVHPGGPFWAKKDDGSWSIPKGLYEGDEDPFVAAKREFEEGTGLLPEGKSFELGTFG